MADLNPQPEVEKNAQYYKDLLVSQRNLRKNTPLNNNPNMLIGNILTPADVDRLTIARNTELNDYNNRIKPDNNIAKDYERIVKKLKSYDLPPIDYEARLPDAYFSAKAERDAEKTAKENARNKIIEQGTQEQLRNFDLKEDNRSPSQAELYYGTVSPYNLDERIAIANLGYDPDLSIDEFLTKKDIPNNPFTGKFALQADLTLNTRNMTKKQWEHLAKRHGLDGELRYMDPANPARGVVYQPKGSLQWHQMDTPEMEISDAFMGIFRELPAIVGDLLFSIKGAKQLEPILKKIPDVNIDFTSGPVQRFLQAGGIGALAGTGTALGEFVRMTVGAATNANDLSFAEIAKESGMMAVMAAGGTAFIGVGLQVLPALYTAATKGRIPPEVLRQIREDLSAAQLSRTKGTIPRRDAGAFGESLSEKEVQEAIEDMVGQTKDAMGPGIEFGQYRPTVGQITGEQRMIDLENAFLRGSADSKVNQQYYTQLIAGNDRLIMAFAKKLAKESREDLVRIEQGKLTRRRVGDEPTGAELSQEILQEIDKKVELIESEAVAMLRGLEPKFSNLLPDTNIGVDIAGNRLMQKVVAEDISNGGNIRYRTRLHQAQHEYMQPFNKAIDDGINDPRLADTTIGSGSVREPTTEWMNARKKADNDLFTNPDADEAIDIFYRMLGANSAETLNRLLGRESVEVITRKKTGKIDKVTGKEIIEEGTRVGRSKFKSGDFSFKELEQARVSLNDIASGLVGKNVLAVRYARSLERGIEAQQYQLIKKAAKEELERLGKKSTPKFVDNYVYHPTKNPEGEFGKEIYANWQLRNEAFEKVHADSIGQLVKTDKNAVVEYLLKGNQPGSPSNTGVAEIMYLLKSQSGGSQVLEGIIPEIQKGLVERVKFILNDETLPNPLARAKAYQGDGYNARFGTTEQFTKTVIKPLEKYEQDIATIRKMFGTQSDPNPNTTNIISGILFSSTKDIQAGLTREKVLKLLPYIENNSVLRENIASELRDVISTRVLKRIEGRTVSGPNPNAVTELFDGYSIKGAGNQKNSFENVIGPLLGENGKKYIKNLRVLDTTLQRELVKASPGSMAAIKEWTDPGISWWKKMFIKPLTQLGRRVTATERLAGTKAARTLGLILQDEKLLDATIKAVEGKATRRAYQKALIAWTLGTGRGDDVAEFLPFSDYWASLTSSEIGDDYTNYDRAERKRKTNEQEEIKKKKDSFNKTFQTLLENNILMGIN